MKKILFIILTLTTTFIYSQTQYEIGYRKGYSEGYCYNVSYGCSSLSLSIIPTPKKFNDYKNYQQGYNDGFVSGKSHKGNGENSISDGAPLQRIPYQYKDPEKLNLFPTFNVQSMLQNRYNQQTQVLQAEYLRKNELEKNKQNESDYYTKRFQGDYDVVSQYILTISEEMKKYENVLPIAKRYSDQLNDLLLITINSLVDARNAKFANRYFTKADYQFYFDMMNNHLKEGDKIISKLSSVIDLFAKNNNISKYQGEYYTTEISFNILDMKLKDYSYKNSLKGHTLLNFFTKNGFSYLIFKKPDMEKFGIVLLYTAEATENEVTFYTSYNEEISINKKTNTLEWFYNDPNFPYEEGEYNMKAIYKQIKVIK
jgi:hypothetical protein